MFLLIGCGRSATTLSQEVHSLQSTPCCGPSVPKLWRSHWEETHVHCLPPPSGNPPGPVSPPAGWLAWFGLGVFVLREKRCHSVAEASLHYRCSWFPCPSVVWQSLAVGRLSTSSLRSRPVLTGFGLKGSMGVTKEWVFLADS